MTRRPFPIRRALSWALAIVAVAFVAWIVPVRDRCWDPQAKASTRVAVSRDAGGCVLHLRTGDARIGKAACESLECEPGVASAMAHARGGLVAGLLGLYGLGTLAWAARWRSLLGLAEIDLSLAQVWRVSVEAQAAGVLLPGGIGGDALRIAAVLGRPNRPGERRSSPSIVIASVLLDRAVGLALVATLAAGLGAVSGGVGAGPLMVVLAALPVAFVVSLGVVRHAPLQRIGWLSEGRLGRVLAPVLAYVRAPRAPRAIALAAASSVLVAATQFVVIRGLVLALGATPTQEKWVYVGTAMAFIVGAIPALPGAWGTADAAFVFFFGLAGLSSAVALAVSLLYRLFWYILALIGAILHVALPAGSAATAAAGPPGGS